MKKLLVATVLALLLIAALATVASADNGPHGGFNGSTEACASCHRIHSATSTDGMLLKTNDVYDLCTSCHDGNGAYTDVVDGIYTTAHPNVFNSGTQGDNNHQLFAGGFENTLMLTDYGNAKNEGGLAQDTTNATADMNLSTTSWAAMNSYDPNTTLKSRSVTSKHNVTGGTGTVWGSGNLQSSSTSPYGAGTMSLECVSCHDPHGNAGRQAGSATGVPVPSYRLLRFTPTGSQSLVSGATAPAFEIASEVGTTTASYWDTALTYAASISNTYYATSGGNLGGNPVVATTAGVLVPDPKVKWYTINNDITKDGFVGALSTRTANTIGTAIFAGPGDYGGRYYGYQRGIITASASGHTVCWNGSTFTVTGCGPVAGNQLFNNIPSHDALGYWCSTCHDRYLAPGGASRTTDSGDPAYHYRHRAQGQSATGMGTGQYVCVDCHNAHGTSATASALTQSASYAGDAALLKADNRAICLRCHITSVNGFNVTYTPNANMNPIP